MSVLPSCWDNIIGISRKEDFCLDDIGRPIDYNISKSGIFIDELKGINLRFIQDLGIQNSNDDLWNKIIKAKENAVRVVQMDALMEISKNNKPRVELFKGNIGSQKYTKNAVISNTYAGVRMYCNTIRGAYFHLTGINTIFGTTGIISMEIYSNMDTNPLYSFDLNTIANRVESNLQDITLPLWNDDYDNLEYYFIYQLTQTPKDNQPTCGCGGVQWCFNRNNSCFADGKATKDRWRQFAMVGGISGDNIDDRENWSTTQVMNGLILIGQYQCSSSIYLCNDESDYDNNEFDIAIAYAIQYKTGEYLMDEFLNTNEISRYTMLGQEAINNNRQDYNARYAVLIDYIKNNIDINRFGCLKCKPNHGFSKGFQKL
jgi:hypothetical protein